MHSEFPKKESSSKIPSGITMGLAATKMLLNPEQCLREINGFRCRAQALVSGLTPEQLTRRPQPGKWSIAECLAHLNMTAATVQKLMARGIAQARQDK